MNIAQKYHRNGFREVRPGVNVYEEYDKAFRQQAIDNFYSMNRRPSLLSTIGKGIWWLAGLCLWTLLAAGCLLGLYEVLRTLVTGRM